MVLSLLALSAVGVKGFPKSIGDKIDLLYNVSMPSVLTNRPF